jgi:predicted neutral ceramidase superfamily lipid hydrolase
MILTATLSALTAIALPILYRSYFVDQVKGRKKLAINEFLAFEQKTISIALATPFLLALAILTGMNRTTLVMITFFTLYAIYFFYPSSKKVEFEMKFFRIIPYKKPKKK